MRLYRTKGAITAPTVAHQRLQRLQTVDVLNWSDQAGSGVFKALDDYRRLGTPESLQDARKGLEALIAVVDVLEARS